MICLDLSVPIKIICKEIFFKIFIAKQNYNENILIVIGIRMSYSNYRMFKYSIPQFFSIKMKLYRDAAIIQ